MKSSPSQQDAIHGRGLNRRHLSLWASIVPPLAKRVAVLNPTLKVAAFFEIRDALKQVTALKSRKIWLSHMQIYQLVDLFIDVSDQVSSIMIMLLSFFVPRLVLLIELV